MIFSALSINIDLDKPNDFVRGAWVDTKFCSAEVHYIQERNVKSELEYPNTELQRAPCSPFATFNNLFLFGFSH